MASPFSDRMLKHLSRLDNDSLKNVLKGLIQDRGFLENVFDTIREAVLVIDQSLRIQFLNAAAKPLLGISPEDIGQEIGKFFKQIPWSTLLNDSSSLPSSFRREVEIFYPEHRVLSFYLMPFDSVKEKAESGFNGEKRHEEKNDIELEETGNSPIDLVEEVLEPSRPFATLIFQDVTESVQAAEVNVENQKVKAITQLAAGVAHELGNPLNSLGIHQQLLRRTLQKMKVTPEIRKALDSVNTSLQEIKRLDAIVKNFLSAVRPVPLKSERIQMNELLTTAVTFMKNEIEDRSIQVQVEIPPGIPELHGDPDQLIQAFFNLIKNAIQAMPDGGTLHIHCDVDSLYVNIHFSDTGKGISEEEMRRILDPFFTTKSAGTGLGLLIVDRIVRAHGGALSIANETAGGAAVTISLPLHMRQVRLLT